MNLKNILGSLFIVIFSVTIMAGCQATDVEQEPVPSLTTDITETPRIEIMGGSPTGLVATTRMNPTDTEETRAVHEPDQPGYCNADMLKIWIFRYFYTSYTSITASAHKDLKYYSTLEQIPIQHYTGLNNSDRYTYKKYDYTSETDTKKHLFSLPALAYSKEDYNNTNPKFTTNEDILTSSSVTENLKLSLKTSDSNTTVITPELFFGNLLFMAYRKDNNQEVTVKTTTTVNGLNTELKNGCFYLNNNPYNFYINSYNTVIYGKLYRIVSQLNVSISEINPEIVEKLEMYLSNVPTKITLSGSNLNGDTHGKYYPIQPASEHKENTFNRQLGIKVSETTDFNDGLAKLSTFLLPSGKGRKMTIRVYYTDKDYIPQKQGTSTQSDVLYVDYEIHPPHNVLLTGDDAAVYTISNAEQKSGSDLYIYKSTTHEFFSYSNVRVNLKGTFDNFFTDNSQ